MKTLIGIIPIFLLVAFLVSCQQENVLEVSQQSDPSLSISFDQGMVSFENLNDFQAANVYFYAHQQDGLWENYFSQTSSFNSMKAAYEKLAAAEFEPIVQQRSTEGYEHIIQIVGEAGNQEAVSVISDPFLFEIANERGMFRVGNDVSRVFYNYILTASSPSADQIKEMEELAEGEVPAYFTKADIVREVINPGRSACAASVENISEYASSPKRRVRADLEKVCVSNGPFKNTSINVNVRNQRRTAGIWFAREANSIDVSVTGTTEDPDNFWLVGPWLETNDVLEGGLLSVTNDNEIKNISVAFTNTDDDCLGDSSNTYGKVTLEATIDVVDRSGTVVPTITLNYSCE